jgi:UDP-N-acetylglucosamine:LPS N-acetylglucosamine transferase
MEEENLAPHILVSEIKRIINDPELAKRMSTAAEGFTDPDAARILAEQILAIALSHAQ